MFFVTTVVVCCLFLMVPVVSFCSRHILGERTEIGCWRPFAARDELFASGMGLKHVLDGVLGPHFLSVLGLRYTSVQVSLFLVIVVDFPPWKALL